MISTDLVDLSRLQFALTAMYHFIFVPLTLGLSFLLVVMEVTYVLTGKQMYKDMTRFWGKLFGINFALGVATGITMEFQFGTNWAYYSHYVGDIFGAPLAIEGLMAFFLESTFIGLFFFGWDRLSKGKHLFATIMMALGSNLSALWILVANGWMMYPTGAEFNFETMRMEMTNFWAVFTSEWAQAKFVHTVAGGYMTGAMFVMAVSAYYLLKRQDVKFAASSFRLAAAFGIVSSILTIHMGDESGFLVTRDQPTKIAAMEATWDTHEAPAPLTLFARVNAAYKLHKDALSCFPHRLYFLVLDVRFVGIQNTDAEFIEICGVTNLVCVANDLVCFLAVYIFIDLSNCKQKKDRLFENDFKRNRFSI